MTLSFLNSDAMIGGGLLTILGPAILGGLILNPMPCVLPVHSIKLMGVVSKRGENRREESWPRLFGQRPAEIEWMSVGLR